MKKILLCMLCVLSLIGCEESAITDDEPVRLYVGPYMNENVFIYVVNEAGEDLLNPETENGIKANSISVSFYKEDGTLGMYETSLHQSCKDGGGRVTVYSDELYAFRLVTLMDRDFPENPKDWPAKLTGKVVINWNNGYGTDELKVVEEKYIAYCPDLDPKYYWNKATEVKEVYLNGELKYNRKEVHPESFGYAYLYIVKK